MTISSGPSIRLRGVRHNNLKNFDLDLPLGKLIVITGLSGSGKSSLAFDTLFAEGQRRYIETFSPYARQFFDRMDKPQVDRIDGIPPAIAIEQRNSVKTTRSTVGTMTEICEYMKVLWAHLGQLHCRGCGEAVHEESPAIIWERLCPEGAAPLVDVMISFALPLSEKMPLADTLDLIAKQGYQRLLLDGEPVRLAEALPLLTGKKPSQLTVLQDRLKLTAANRARFAEACEHAYHFGKGKLVVHRVDNRSRRLFSRGLHCATCDLDYRPPTPALFSFNHPLGACASCRGFGRIITIDYDRAIPDRSKSLAGGAVKPWQTGQGQESQRDLLKFCARNKIKTDIPFRDLPLKHQQLILAGDPDHGKDAQHEWPRSWYGVKGYFRWLESKAYKMHVRVLLSRYRAYSTCPECQGRRFTPDSLLYQIEAPDQSRLTLSDFYQLSITEALALVKSLSNREKRGATDPVALALHEVASRLRYLVDVGLGYLTLDRPTRSLSGGETERVNLTTCLGSRLVNTLYVLDEPSVGLHPRDTTRLVNVLHDLRDTGNTVVVVEHEASVMRSADQIVDLGPGHGESGGRLVFQGSYDQILSSKQSLTGQYLGGTRQIPLRPRRPAPSPADGAYLKLEGANRNNLKNVSVSIPLGRFVCLTGVSGSGKTTLAREVLVPALEECLGTNNIKTAAESSTETEKDSDADEISAPVQVRLQGFERLRSMVLIDQSSLGKTPRSNPAVYIGAFDDIRDLFATTETARQRGLNSSAFSFNSAQGQCERCRGAGFEKIEMQFLSDVFVRCAECQGRRYRPHILEIKLAGSVPGTAANGGEGSKEVTLHWSIADLLEASVDEAIPFLLSYFHLSAGRRALQSLKLLQEVGLGYLRLGQPVNTLSGGESQRLKLVKHLAEFSHSQQAEAKPTLLIFDEPTTGLHFEDVRVLLEVFHRLVDAGHSLLIIEHNLDVIRSADWVIDLGPEAGREGGTIVVAGTPEMVAACPASHTGQALRDLPSSLQPRAQ